MNRRIEGLRLLSDNCRSLYRTLILCSLLVAFILSGIYLSQLRVLEILNLKITDVIRTSTKSPQAKFDIVTVAIDEASLEKFGQWPWPRYRIAQLLEKISAGGAKSIGIDVIFAEQDRTSPLLWQKNLKNDFGTVIDTSDIPAEILDHDVYLANTLSQGKYILGYTFFFDKALPNQQKCIFHPLHLLQVSNNSTPAPTTHFHQAKGFVCNYEVLAKAATGSGFLNGAPDRDGVLRRLPLLIDFNDNTYPSFALAVLLQLQHTDTCILQQDSARITRLSLDEFHIPIDEHGNFLLGPTIAQDSKKLTATEVLSGEIHPDFFRDKVVLVGLTVAGLTQEYSTPWGLVRSSLDLQKYALESLMSKLQSVRTDLFPVWESVISIILCLLLAACVAYFPTFWVIIFSLLSIGFCWFTAIATYQNSGYLFSPLLPTLSVLLASSLLLLLKFYYFQQQAKTETGDTLLLLKSSQTSLHSILQTIPDIIFRLDTRGNITFISPAISKYLEFPKPLLGQPIFELVVPEDLDKAQYRLNERRTGERATYDLELRLQLTKDSGNSQKTPRFFSLSAEGIYRSDESGRDHFLGTQGIFRDITNRKRLEHQLMQAQKMEAIGNLAAGIAHDLNNILSGLVSYPDLLLLEIPQEDPLYKKIQMIQQSGKKAAVIVQDLLTLARRSVTVDEVCDINSIISEYLASGEFQQIKARHPQTGIHTDLQNSLLHVKGSSVHLSKVIMNSLINSLEAMPAGGNIVISTNNIYLDTLVRGYENIPAGEYVRISISDSGIGIGKEDLTRIFEPFYTKKSMRHSGTGLGMTVVWATIKDHKGYIDIASEEGRGTTFKFYLPATRKTASAQQQSRIVLDDYVGSETVLIVDDAVEQIEIAKNMLIKLGYTVHSATSGEKAVKMIKQQPVDLIILDMIMPGGIDGLDTYQEIIQFCPNQKAIITSGFSESERVKKLLQLGAGGYVQKPYAMQTLGIAVRNELNRKREG